MTGPRQRVRAGQPGRTGADHSDAPSCRRTGAIELAPAREQRVGRMALQPSDLHRPRLRGLAHAGTLAEVFRRTHTRAHRAHDVGIEDGLGSSNRKTIRDLPDEERNVDLGRARRDARRVVAEQAALGGDARLVGMERRNQVLEILAA